MNKKLQLIALQFILHAMEMLFVRKNLNHLIYWWAKQPQNLFRGEIIRVWVWEANLNGQ